MICKLSYFSHLILTLNTLIIPGKKHSFTKDKL